MKTKDLLAASILTLACATALMADPMPGGTLLEQMAAMPAAEQAAAFEGGKVRPAMAETAPVISVTRESVKSRKDFKAGLEPWERYQEREARKQELRERERDSSRYPPTSRGVEASAPDWAILAAMLATLVLMIIFITI